jgi:hypothetical protein
MKKISYVFADLATIAIAAPAIAQDKPLMEHGMMYHHKHHHMMHDRMTMHHHHHHMMQREVM